jgi:hypothetical protein
VRWYLTYRLSYRDLVEMVAERGELAHRVRKRQFSSGRGGTRRFCSLKHLWARALACHDAATDGRKVTVATLNRNCTRTQALAC